MNVGSANNWIEANVISNAHRYGLYLFEGDDSPEPDEDGGPGTVRCHENTFTNNSVYDCTSDFIKVNGADSNVFVANVFVGSNPTLRFERGTNNLVVGNLVPANALVKLVGATTNFNSAIFKQQPRLSMQLDPYSTARLADDASAIFEFSGREVDTVVDRTGSTASVTSAQVGTGATTVWTRDFFVIPGSRDVLIHPTLWEVTGELRKQWTSRAESTTASILYTVGDLTASHPYVILKNGATLTLAVSDSNGRLSFADASGHTGSVHYAIAPTNQPPPEAVVAVTASDASVSESGLEAGTFIISRSGDRSSALAVKYVVGGRAVSGRDYEPLPGSAFIPAGEHTANVIIRPIDDTRHERAEAVRLTLTPDPTYNVNLLANSASLSIRDNDPKPITLTASFAATQIGETNAMLALTWNATVGQSYQLQYKLQWNATNWMNHPSVLTATNDFVTLHDFIGSEPQRFYRVVELR